MLTGRVDHGEAGRAWGIFQGGGEGRQERLKEPREVSSPSVPPLNPDQVSRLRDSMGKGRGSDVSPGAKFSAEMGRQRDEVILTDLTTGSARSLPLGVAADEITVSDRGDVVVAYPELDRETYLANYRLGSLQPDGQVRPLPLSTQSWKGARNPEISGDGSRLAYTDAGDGAAPSEGYIYVDGPAGHIRARFPERVTGNEFLEDGRLLVQTERVWNSVRIPSYHLVDDAGHVARVTDVATAEALGGQARARLTEAYAAGLPGATAQQCRELVDQFGYRLPDPIHSQGRSHLFWVPRGEDGQPFGLYGLEHGQGSARRALSEADAAAVGCRPPDTVHWDPNQRGAALVFEGRVAVVDFRGGSHLLPGVVGPGTANLQWSRDGRWLAVETVREGNTPGVDVFDTQTGNFTSVAAEGRLSGWNLGDVQVQVGAGTRSVHIGDLGKEALRDELLGSRSGTARDIQVGQGEVRIGGISLSRREER